MADFKSILVNPFRQVYTDKFKGKCFSQRSNISHRSKIFLVYVAFVIST